jgi:hypothetical protein
VDHPLPAPDALVRPWRTAAYVAGAVALLELLLLLVLGGGRLAAAVSDRVQLEARERALAPAAHEPAAQVARKAKRTPPAALPRRKTVVLVLNGNGRTGAAAAAASRVSRRGYRIGKVGNAPELVPRSIVMFKPGFAGEGKRLARDLRVRLVTPLDGMRPAALGRAHVVFVLGP